MRHCNLPRKQLGYLGSALKAVLLTSVKPSFDLPLLTTLAPAFARGSPTPTFTRATTASVTDFEGVIRTAISGEARFQGARRVQNLIAGAGGSTTLTSWAKGGTATITAGATDPLGGTTAYQIDFPASGDSIAPASTSACPAGALLISMWIKADAGGTIRVSEGGSGQPDTTLTVTTSWQRMQTAVGSTLAAGNRIIDIRRNSAGQLSKIYLWHPQMEVVSGASVQVAGNYVSVGELSAPYHGAGVDGVKYFATQNGNTVASNVVTEATGAAISTATLLGYLAEGQRTNICLWSNDLTNAAWTASNVTTAKTATGPDGVANSATTLTASAGNGTVLQAITSGSAARVTGCWIKRRTGTGTINLTQDNGSTWTAVTVTSSWTQVVISSATAANPTVGIRIVTSGDAVDVWCFQHEVATFVSSPIPTTSASVTRNADDLRYVAAANISNSLGTAYCEVTTQKDLAGSTTPVVLGSDSGAGQAFFYAKNGAANLASFDGTNVRTWGAWTTPNTTPLKMALAWSNSSQQAAISGVASASQGFDGSWNITTNIHICNNGALTGPLFGTIRNLRIYPTALSDSVLASMTT